MKIGELQRRTGLSVRMLRYRKAEGLLAPVRTAKEYRYYDLGDEQVVIRIRLLEAGGITLAVIYKFLPCVRGDRPVLEPCDELRCTLH